MTNYFIRDGFVEKVSNKDSDATTTGFDMKRWLKRNLTFLGVAFYDRCCGSVAIDATATATAAEVVSGLITSTSAAATSITLPTASILGSQIGAVRGTTVEFTVDNSTGASIVTVVVGSGIVAKSALTGGTTLTVPVGAAGTFKIYFYTATTAQISRIA